VIIESKPVVRRRLAGARAALTAAEQAVAGEAIGRAGVALAVGVGAQLVAGYASVAPEPPTGPLLAALARAGRQVLLPAVRSDGALDWIRYYPGEPLVPGRFGLPEPVGERFGPEALAKVGLAFVPALGVDRSGRRLGRGGGYIDRALSGGRPRLVFAVVYDGELLDRVPGGAADQPVDGVLRPAGTERFG